MLGLTRYLRAHRGQLRAANAIVIGIGPCGNGRPCWWTGDGPLLALRFLPRLGRVAERAASLASPGGPVPHRGRGLSPAYPARLSGLPAITIGCLDEHGLPARSHLPSDRPDRLDRGAADRLLEFALTLVDAIDAELPDAPNGRAAASRTAV